MNVFVGELIGTFLLILLGNGVVANVVLNKTKGHNSGWIVITFGWAIAVFVGVFVAAKSSGAHLNPAVTLALAMIDKAPLDKVPQYLGGQMLGAMLASFIVWVMHFQHFNETENADAKLAVFSTSPAIRHPFFNLFSEVVGTFVLIIGVLCIITPSNSLGALDALPVALLVLGIGLGLGGPTGYCINPVRDLGPRIMHAILPIRGKGSSDWGYAWIPVIGPLLGAVLAVWVFRLFQ